MADVENLCDTCAHSISGDKGHVTREVLHVQRREQDEFRRTGKENKRILEEHGVPTNVELPGNLAELLKNNTPGFSLMICYYVQIDSGCMYDYPAIRKNTEIMLITADKQSIVKSWRTLEPRTSKLVTKPWMVNVEFGVGYRMHSDPMYQRQSRPCKIFSKHEIEALFTNEHQPFEWAPGLLGEYISRERFEMLIEDVVAA